MLSSPRQVGPDAAGGDIKNGGHFLDRPVFHIEKQERSALFFRQLPDSTIERFMLKCHIGGDSTHYHFRPFINRFGLPFPSALTVDKTVVRNTEQPGAEAAPATEGVRCNVGVHQRVLRDVIGLGWVTAQREQEPPERFLFG